MQLVAAVSPPRAEPGRLPGERADDARPSRPRSTRLLRDCDPATTPARGVLGRPVRPRARVDPLPGGQGRPRHRPRLPGPRRRPARGGVDAPTNLLRNMMGVGMAGPTLVAFGTEEQQAAPAAARVHLRGHLVPDVQRAGRRLRRRVARDACRARRRRVGRERSEGVDEHGARRRAGACCSPAPTPTSPSTAASRTSSSTCTSPASRCARCAR